MRRLLVLVAAGSWDCRRIGGDTVGRAAPATWTSSSAPSSGSMPSVRMASRRFCPPANTGVNKSPWSASRCQIVAIVKSLGRKGSSTSSQCRGVATDADRSGRGEYVTAMFLPSVFMLWSKNTTSGRRSTDHSIVVRSGSARLIRRHTLPTHSRTCDAVWTRSMGT